MTKRTRHDCLSSSSAPLLPLQPVGYEGFIGGSEYLRVSERLLSSFRLWQCLSFWKLISHAFHARSLNPLMFSRAEPCALKPLSSMLMFSDWLMNLLINPLVCAAQHCPWWNAIRGKRSHDRVTRCQRGFQSQWQFVLKWSAGLILSATYFCEKSLLRIKK